MHDSILCCVYKISRLIYVDAKEYRSFHSQEERSILHTIKRWKAN